jgi:hypothetical protein
MMDPLLNVSNVDVAQSCGSFDNVCGVHVEGVCILQSTPSYLVLISIALFEAELVTFCEYLVCFSHCFLGTLIEHAFPLLGLSGSHRRPLAGKFILIVPGGYYTFFPDYLVDSRGNGVTDIEDWLDVVYGVHEALVECATDGVTYMVLIGLFPQTVDHQVCVGWKEEPSLFNLNLADSVILFLDGVGDGGTCFIVSFCERFILIVPEGLAFGPLS